MPEENNRIPGYPTGSPIDPPPGANSADQLSGAALDSLATKRYTLDTMRAVFGLALAQLESFTEESQNRPFPNSKGELEMASNCRRRVTIGTNDVGKPLVKWACGRTEDEVNDSIVRIYIENGLIQDLLPAREAANAGPAIATPVIEEKGEDGISFGTYAQNWLSRYKSNLKATTLKGYRSYLRKHLLPEFGEMNLLEISVDDLQDFLNDRKELAHKTLREFIVFLRQIFDGAMEDKKLTFNPARSKKLHNPSDKVTVREALPLEIVLQILQDICGLEEDERRLMALLLLTGMRRGEVLGLRWEDIDFEKKMLSVQRNVTFPSNQPNITTPKTENGVRQVPVDDNLIILLDRPTHAKGYVIGGRKPITLTQYRYMYEKIERQVDLHEATAHIFRHSYLTLLDAAGVDPKTLQSIAGHGDFKITMNRYVHGREKEISAAGTKLSSMMNVSLSERPTTGKAPGSEVA